MQKQKVPRTRYRKKDDKKRREKIRWPKILGPLLSPEVANIKVTLPYFLR